MTTKDEALKLALDDLIAEYDMEKSSFAKRVDEIFKQALAAQPAPAQDASKQFHEWAVAEHAALAAKPASVHALRSAIANDAWAISFQSLGQYRSALLKLIDTEQASQEKGWYEKHK